MRKRPLINVGVIVLNEDTKKILLGKAQKVWKIVESELLLNEDFQDCAIRGLYEQIGLRVDYSRLKFVCTFNAVDKQKLFHSIEIYFLLTIPSQLEKFIYNKSKTYFECWVWFDFNELTEVESDFFLGLKLFMKKFKITSFEVMKSIESN